MKLVFKKLSCIRQVIGLVGNATYFNSFAGINMKKVVTVIVVLIGCSGISFAGRMSMDLESRGGLFIGAATSNNPETLGLEFGATGYSSDYPGMSLNGSLVLLDHQHASELLTGLKLGVRYEPQWRIAPFVGLGGFWVNARNEGDRDGKDNDHDGLTDESDEAHPVFSDEMAGISPEIGLNLWINNFSRFSLNWSYNFSTSGRKSDFKMIGLTFGLFWGD